MEETNLFDELKAVLDDLEQFLTTNGPTIKPIIEALGALFEEVVQLLDLLIKLLDDLVKEIDRLDNLPDVKNITSFIDKTKTLIDATSTLLAGQSADIDKARSLAGIVTSLPSLSDLTDEIKESIGVIRGQLVSFKPGPP